MPEVYMWSKTVRKERSIFEEGDTNMLIEAYVNAFLSDDKITDIDLAIIMY